LFDQFDPETGFSSMARTTGFTCTAIASLFLDGKSIKAGINPPEFLGPDCFEEIIEYLENRNILYIKSVE